MKWLISDALELIFILRKNISFRSIGCELRYLRVDIS